ncbi:hypothetical protein JHK86_048144 [Glycine max]|nr:hypothetical protein JHK86_048144 [Glycine max]
MSMSTPHLVFKFAFSPSSACAIPSLFYSEEIAVHDFLQHNPIVENKAKDNNFDDNVDFVVGNVKLITTKEVWDQYLEEARRDGKIFAHPSLFFRSCAQEGEAAERNCYSLPHGSAVIAGALLDALPPLGFLSRHR